MQRFNVFVRCMLVNFDVISKLAIKYEVPKSKNSLVKEKESFIVSSLLLRVFSSWSQNLAKLQVGVPIADRIEQKDGVPSSNALWILANPYRTPGLKPDRYKSLLSFLEISP